MRVLLGVLLIATSVAHADNDVAAAKAEAAKAESLAASQQYIEAAARFRAAYRLDPAPAYLCNVGVAFQRARELPRARLYLDACLRKGHSLDPKFLDLVRKVVADVDGKLRAGDFAPVDIGVEPAGGAVTISTFDADETFVGSQVVWLPFGAHTISVTAEGYAPLRRAVTIESRTQVELRFELERMRPVTLEQPSPPRPDVVSPQSPTPERPTTTVRARSNVPAIVSTALTLTAGGVAVGTFLRARSLMDEAGSTTIYIDEYDARVDRARRWQHMSWAFAGAAGVGAIVSAALWMRSTSTTTVEVHGTDGGGSVSLSGAW